MSSSPGTIAEGLLVLSAPDHAKPWLISGAGRSGTTALTAVVQALGLTVLYSQTTNLEENTLRYAWQKRDLDTVKSVRMIWNAGVVCKAPGLAVAAWLDDELRQVIDCNYLLAFRDPVAQVPYDQLQHPGAAVGDLLRQRTLIAQQNADAAIGLSQAFGVLAVSYEKLLQPRSNWRLIASLCAHIGGDPERIEEAVNVLEAERKEYRDNVLARLHGHQHLDPQ